MNERSQASNNHYFAWLNDAWKSLPADAAEHFPTAEHLRKWALIRTGYSDSHSVTCDSKACALRVATFVRSIDDMATVITSGTTVTRYTAKSQSSKTMEADEFQQSKDAVMRAVAQMIPVEIEDRS
jgi:hypothetical protein